MAALIQYANGAPGIKYDLSKRQLIIGRSSRGSDICLPCSYVSKHHAVIELVDSTDPDRIFDYYIVDLESTNKTFVNDEPIVRTKLKDGDYIRIGRTTMKFVTSGPGVPVEAEPVLLTEADIIEVDELEEIDEKQSQSSTWTFSRRLSVMED